VSKVILPKEVAAAIEKIYKKTNGSYRHIALTNWDFLSRLHYDDSRVLIAYAKDHPIEYMRALVEDYEVEKTNEEKVKNYYREQSLCETENEDHVCTAIQKVLRLLEIKIEGVNA
jgi:hypothetical protein